jgi:hypothetical protein
MTAGWQPLSVRRGRRDPESPFEGIPPHLQHPVGEWLRGQFGWHDSSGMNDFLMATVASACRIPVRSTYNSGGISEQIFEAIERDEDLYLDCLDVTLHVGGGRGNADGLTRVLQVGGSVWTVGESKHGLERRVSEATGQAFALAVAVSDPVAEELKQAWSAVFGRNPDSSDAWDHAIKAVEELLIPIVVPKVEKANLGTVAGELKTNPQNWNFGLPSNGGRGNGETLEGLIRHIWPNPDRHGGPTNRQPTPEEAQAAVQIAIVIVGLCRGRLVKKP